VLISGSVLGHSADRERWKARVKVKQGARLAWYAGRADETYWASHWRQDVRASYYEAASRFDLSKDPVGRAIQRHLPPGSRILEAGCGPGFWVAALTEAGYRIEGVDFSRALVRAAIEHNPTLPIAHGDATALDYPADLFDGYLSFGVIEHNETGPEAFLGEAFRVVKPGGKALFTVPHNGIFRRWKARAGCYQTTPPDAAFFQYAFRPEELSRYIRQAGFAVCETFNFAAHRLLVEELPLYREMVRGRGGRYLKSVVDRVLEGTDGHMLAIVADKPAAPPT
jgi:SAM-dependent methyltransferase